jgi:hypothetical protein
MKSALVVAGVFICLTVGLVITQQTNAGAEPVTAGQLTAAQSPAAQVPIFNPEPEMAKKCSFSSDCPYGKCSKGKCGACSFTSDCKGWGKCSKGQCGACSFSSECKGFGKCSGGRCTKSPY